VGLAIYAALQRWLSMDMDELLCYSPLGLLYPYNIGDFNGNNRLANTLAIIPGHFWPLRSYYYIGSVHALFYLPLYLVFPHFWSVRLVGLLFLAAQSVFISRLVKLPSSVIFLLLVLFFPYSVQHFIDAGPVALHCLLIYVLLFLFEFDNGRRPLRRGALVGFLVFIGIWEKLSFLLLLPGLSLLAISALLRLLKSGAYSRVRIVKFALSAGLTSGIPTALLLCARDIHQVPYFRVMSTFSSRPENLWVKMTYLSACIFNPLQTLERFLPATNYNVLPWSILGTVIIILMLVVVVLGHRSALKASGKNDRLLARYISLPIAAFVISYPIIAYRGLFTHHVILAFPFLILSLSASVAALVRHATPRCRRIGLGALMLSLALYAPCWAYLSHFLPSQGDDWSRFAIHEKLYDETLSRHYAYIVGDWGYYYLQWIYGNHDQMVLGDESVRTPEQVARLQAALKMTGRKALFVLTNPNSSCDLDLLRRSFNLVAMPGISPDARWQVLMEP